MKPCHFLNMFLTFRHLKPYVLKWFVLIKKACSKWRAVDNIRTEHAIHILKCQKTFC